MTDLHLFPGRDGVELAWRSAGSGRPFVLLHGLIAGALAALLQHGRVALVPGDHFTALDAPEFTAAVLEFLAGPLPSGVAGQAGGGPV